MVKITKELKKLKSNKNWKVLEGTPKQKEKQVMDYVDKCSKPKKKKVKIKISTSNRGKHPNSKANLNKGNKATEFKSGRVAVEAGKKGGEKTAENEKARKTYKELFLGLSETPITKENDLSDGKLHKMITTAFPNLPIDEITQQVSHYASLHRIVLKGGKGAVAAFVEIRNTMGEKPTDKIDHTHREIVIDEEDEEIMKKAAMKKWGLKNG